MEPRNDDTNSNNQKNKPVKFGKYIIYQQEMTFIEIDKNDPFSIIYNDSDIWS